MRIGIDIGGVIIGGGGDDTQFFGDDFWNTPELPGARQAIYELHRAKHEIHLISKCGPKIENRSIIWLGTFGYIPSPIRQHHIHFVRKRELKAPMAQALELDIFIDDRQDVLDHMVGTVPHLILFTSWDQTNEELEKIFAVQG